MAKTVPFFENTVDNHCMQSCLKSVLEYNFPTESFSDEKIDSKTYQTGGWSWLPPAAIWLNDLGLQTTLYSELDYSTFAQKGEEYLQEIWAANGRYENEKQNGSLENIAAVQRASKEMVDLGLWRQQQLSIEDLNRALMDVNTLAIGKTVQENLRGVEGKTGHYILLIREYSPLVWEVHDPGFPGAKASKKIPQKYKGNNILNDVLLVTQKNS